MPRVSNDENQPPTLIPSQPRTTPRTPKSSSKTLKQQQPQIDSTQQNSTRISEMDDSNVIENSGVEIEVQAPTSENASRRSASVRRSSRAPSLGIVTSSVASTSLQPIDNPTPKSRSRSTSARPPTPKPTSTPKKATKSKSKSKSKSARPSETLQSAPSTPESEGEDPLLLRGGSEMRGWGEGKPKREGSWGGESFGGRSREGSAVSQRRRSISARRDTATPDRERRREEEYANQDQDWTIGFDTAHFDDVKNSSVAASSRDYQVPVHFTSSPARKSATTFRRPPSPAPLRSAQLSSPVSSPAQVIASNEAPLLEDEIIAPNEMKVEEGWKDGIDFFDSESSTVEEQNAAEQERWKGPEMSEDSVDAVSEVEGEDQDMVEDEEEEEEGEENIVDEVSLALAVEAEFEEMEERTVSPAPSDTATTPRHSVSPPPTQSTQISQVLEVEVVEQIEMVDQPSRIPSPLPSTSIEFSPLPPEPTALVATRIQYPSLPKLPSLLLSIPPPPPLPPTPILHFSRRQSTVLPTPQQSTANNSTGSNLILQSARKSSGSRRVSHPSRPVIEIFSEDPKAAAEAAAFLKLRHGYREEDLEYEEDMEVDSSEDSLRRESGRGPRKSLAEREGKLKELLNQAERKLREEDDLPNQQSLQRSAVTQSVPARKEVPSSLPARKSEVIAFDFDRKWNSSDWRKLEQALVDEKRLARRESRELRVKDIIWGYLDSQGLQEDELERDWAWDKLIIRIEALQQRRARDSASRASSVASSSARSQAPIDRRNHSEVAKDRARELQRRPAPIEEKRAEEEEEEEDDEDHEDTFYGQTSKQSQPSVPVLALKSSRHAHLYEIPVEKPRVEEWSGGFRIKTEELDDGVPSEADSSGEMEEVKGPGSASKLLSYLGSFVRRSNVAVSPAPPQSSASPSPVVSSSLPFEPAASPPTLARDSLPKPSPKLPPRLTEHLPPRPPAPTALLLQQTRKRLSNGSVQESIDRIEDAENSREENVLPFDLTGSASASRGSGMRKRSAEEELRRGKKGGFVPAGTRALDRSG